MIKTYAIPPSPTNYLVFLKGALSVLCSFVRLSAIQQKNCYPQDKCDCLNSAMNSLAECN